MPRVSRNYQHQDFSHLLTPQQVHDKPKPKKQKQPPVITPEKRHRDSLMADRKMRYILSHTGKIHDRDCPHAVQIPDDAFDMCEDYPNGRYVCFVCYRKALVRKGLALDQTKFIDAAMRVFREVGATNSDLNMPFLKYDAQIYRIETDSVYLKVNEDCWIIETATNGCMLYHNNYQVFDDFQRLMESGFHPQADRVITFRNALITMCQYTWEGHIQAMEAKRKVQRQEALRHRLSLLRGHQMTTKRSVFFRYFLLAVPANYPEQLPCRTIKKEVQQFGDLCLCRVLKWKADTIDAIENIIKTYCVEHECLDYEQLCMQNSSDAKEVILMSGQFEDGYHYNGTNYSIIKREPRKCLDPKEYGLSPDGNCCSACWDGYWCEFAIVDNRLLLQDLYVDTTDDYYPTIAGVAVQAPDHPWEFPAYKNLYIPVPWTGKVLAGDGFIKEHYAHLGYQRIWAYQVIKEFIFKDGNLIEVNDLSELGKQLRPLAPKRDFYGLWDYKKAAPMEQYHNAWWAE